MGVPSNYGYFFCKPDAGAQENRCREFMLRR